jgi:hypothetical protein
MSPQKYILIPVFIAFQAFIMMVVYPFVPGNLIDGGGLLTWIAFQAWAMYFLAGCKPDMALKVLAGYAGGIIASIAIIEIGGNLLGGLNMEGGVQLGIAIAVFIVVIPVIAAEKLPGINFIPAWFVGSGVFFALITYNAAPEEVTCPWHWYTRIGVTELVACVIGLGFGYCTVTFRTWYEGKYTPVEEAVAVEVEAKTE